MAKVNQRVQQRIIPAYAGKSSVHDIPLQAHKDHPRLRGEKGRCFLLLLQPAGSSPLTRGKAILSVLSDCHLGIIPAYAGKRLKKVIKSF